MSQELMVIESSQILLSEATQRPDHLLEPVVNLEDPTKVRLLATMKDYGQLFTQHVTSFLREGKDAMIDAVIDRGFLKVTPKCSTEESGEVEQHLRSITVELFDRWLTQNFSHKVADGISANPIFDKAIVFEDRILFFAKKERFNLTFFDRKISADKAIFALLFATVEVCENRLAVNASKTMTAGIESDNPFLSRAPYQFNQGFPKFIKEKILHLTVYELLALGNKGPTGFSEFCQTTHEEFCKLTVEEFEEFLSHKAASDRRDLQFEWQTLTTSGFTESDLMIIDDSSNQLAFLTYLGLYQLEESFSWLEKCLESMSRDNFLRDFLQAIIDGIQQACKPDLSLEMKTDLLKTLNQLINSLKFWGVKEQDEKSAKKASSVEIYASSSDDPSSEDDLSSELEEIIQKEVVSLASIVPDIQEKVTDCFIQLKNCSSTNKIAHIAELQLICMETPVICVSADADTLSISIERLKILAKKTDAGTAAEVDEYVMLVEQTLTAAQDREALYQSFFDTTELYCFVLNNNAKLFDDAYRDGIVTNHQKAHERAQLAQNKISKRVFNEEESLLHVKVLEYFENFKKRHLRSMWIDWLRACNIDVESYLKLRWRLDNFATMSVSLSFVAQLFIYLDQVMHVELSSAEANFLAAIVRSLIHALVRGQRSIEVTDWHYITGYMQPVLTSVHAVVLEEEVTAEDPDPDEDVGLEEIPMFNKFGHIRNLFFDFCKKFSIEHPGDLAPLLTATEEKEYIVALWADLEYVFGDNRLVYSQQTAKADDLEIALAKLNHLIEEKKYLRSLPPNLEEIVARYIATVKQLPSLTMEDPLYKALYETTQLYCFALNDKAAGTWLDEIPTGPQRAVARATYAQEEIEKIWDDSSVRNKAQQLSLGRHSAPYHWAMTGCALMIVAGSLGIVVGILGVLASLGTIAFAGLGALGLPAAIGILSSSIATLSTGSALVKRTNRRFDQPIEATALAGLSLFKHQQQNIQEANEANMNASPSKPSAR
jgi:hypothetical protein